MGLNVTLYFYLFTSSCQNIVLYFSHYTGCIIIIIIIIIVVVFLLGAPLLPTWWVKISIYFHLEAFFFNTSILLIVHRMHYYYYYYYYYYKLCPSARCASAANAVCRNVDVFGARNILLKQIL
jgi:hypothetical protein